jgi:hypothetical protein
MAAILAVRGEAMAHLPMYRTTTQRPSGLPIIHLATIGADDGRAFSIASGLMLLCNAQQPPFRSDMGR